MKTFVALVCFLAPTLGLAEVGPLSQTELAANNLGPTAQQLAQTTDEALTAIEPAAGPATSSQPQAQTPALPHVQAYLMGATGQVPTSFPALVDDMGGADGSVQYK